MTIHPVTDSNPCTYYSNLPLKFNSTLISLLKEYLALESQKGPNTKELFELFKPRTLLKSKA